MRILIHLFYQSITTCQVFDTNGDGVISREELKAMMLNLGEDLSDRDIDSMIKAVDTDGDGMVNFEEFVNLLDAK